MRGSNPEFPEASFSRSQAAAARGEELYEGAPYTAHELLRWADLVLERVGIAAGGLLAVRIDDFRQRPAVDALRLMCEHRRAELCVLVAGIIGAARIDELQNRGAVFLTLHTPSTETERDGAASQLDASRLSEALGEPQAMGELIEWPGEHMAALAHPGLGREQALRRYALDLLAALESA